VPITTSIPDALHALANAIKSQNVANYIEVISSAKVPIVKLDHFHSGLSIDLQINNTTGLSTGNQPSSLLIHSLSYSLTHLLRYNSSQVR
jgi:hypothetical protein